MAGGQLSSNPAAPTELTARYSKLFLDYRLAVNAAHFSGPLPAQQQAGAGAGGAAAAEVWEWQGPGGIRAAQRPAVLAFLAAPRLPPHLDRYLHPQQPQQRQQ